MAQNITMSDLIEEAKDLADQQGSTFVLTTEMLRVLNRSALRYKQLQLKLDPDSIAVAEETITGDGSSSYSLNASHMSIVGVYWVSGTNRIKLRPYQLPDRERWDGITANQATHYRMNGQASIELRPAPSSGSYVVVYIAAPAVIDETTDTIDGIGGFESLMVYDLAMHMATKEDSRRNDIARMREEDKKEVIALLSNKKLTTTPVVQDVYNQTGLADPAEIYPRQGDPEW